MSKSGQMAPELLIYKEIGDGDMRKLLGESNDSPTGGGARDLRLPWKSFRHVMHRIFTKEAIGKGNRPIRTAQVTYIVNGRTEETVLEYWPPTIARPAEDRVSKIHASPALSGKLPDRDRGRIFLFIILWSNGEVRCYYAYEQDLRAPSSWSSNVRSAVLGCMADTDLKNAGKKRKLPIQGYFDFTTGTVFCHAR